DLPNAESYSFRAGEEAARAGASREALQHFREAARLDRELHGEPGDAQHRQRIEKNIGLALMNTGRLSESLLHFDQALLHLGERAVHGTIAVQRKFAVDLIAVVAEMFLAPAARPRRKAKADD